MKKFSSLFIRQRWLGFSGATLLALLQRTPALQVAMETECALSRVPVVAVLRSVFVTSASLGAIHGLAGATLLTTNSHPSPLNVTAGVPIPTVVFGVSGTQGPDNSWQVGGSFPPGLTFGGFLTGPGVINATGPTLVGTPKTAGTYSMTLQAWENPSEQGSASPIYTYNVVVAAGTGTAPAITGQPLTQTVGAGASVTLSATATGSPAPSYQWSRNGTVISGATNPSLTLTSFSAAAAGVYTVTATNTVGAASSTGALVVLPAPTSGNDAKLSAIACRAFVGTGGNVLIPGIVVSGSNNKQVLLRGGGPSLTAQGVAGALAQPVLQLFSGATVVVTNQGWENAPNAAAIRTLEPMLGLVPYPAGAQDSAILVTLPPGGYTAQLSGLNNTSGTGLIEVYEVP